MSPHTAAAQPSVAATPIPQVIVDSHDDKAWRDTLLKVAAILCERQPTHRRLSPAPPCTVAEHHQHTPGGKRWPYPTGCGFCRYGGGLSVPACQRGYDAVQQVEKSVLLAPYWLDGHCLSAQTAQRLGYKQVADAIRDELTRFLERLPQLTGLLFNDRTPFISEQTKQWLSASPTAKWHRLRRPVRNRRRPGPVLPNRGWSGAAVSGHATRRRSPRSVSPPVPCRPVDEEAGLVQLAQQQYRMLLMMGGRRWWRLGAIVTCAA